MLINMLALLQHYRKDERGATAIEYGLIAAGIALVISAAVFTFGGELRGLFEGMGDSLSGAGDDAGGSD